MSRFVKPKENRETGRLQQGISLSSNFLYVWFGLVSCFSYLDTWRGKSSWSNPLRMMLYTFMGSVAVKGGLHSINNRTSHNPDKKVTQILTFPTLQH